MVRFVDDAFEGRQEWVSPARLKAPWAAADVYKERDALWDRIYALGPPADDPGERAADEVFDTLIDAGTSRMEFREAGACRITDAAQLAELCTPWVST